MLHLRHYPCCILSDVANTCTEPSSPRRPRSTQRKSYRVGEEYSFLDEDDDGSAPSGTQTPAFQNNDDEDEDDFLPDAQEEEPEDDFEDDVVEEGEDDAEEKENSDEDFDQPRRRGEAGRPLTFPAVQLKQRLPDNIPSPVTFTRGGGIKVRREDPENKLRTRGIPDFDKIGGHEPRLKNLFGPDNDHLRPIITSRDYWYPQETFPIRNYAKTKFDDTVCGSLRRSFFESDGAREKENKALSAWYSEIGRAAFAGTQEVTTLTKDEAKPYLSNSGPEMLNVLLGSVNNSQVHTLKQRSYTNIATSFPNNPNRRGWLIYLGSRVHDAQWSTNENGSTQYIAVAVEQQPPKIWQPKLMEDPKAPAFSATERYAASVQIWAFEATEEGDLDTSKEPRLELVICTDWGAPKQLRWCPVAATDGKEYSDNEQPTHIGMLAGIWSDGRVRILDISAPNREPGTDGPTYVRYSRAAFDVSCPQTVASCLHWMSGTTLAVATAAGTVAIWTLPRPGILASPETHDHNPKPWFYQQLADTFILTIASGWPSQPHYLSISTADGFARLFDIRSPVPDTSTSIRGRTFTLTQAWHDHTQAFVMPDEHYMLKHTPIRRYYHNLYTMRIESPITRVATSPVHPGILVGGADGTIEASNPVGRIANYKIMPWQQKWFVHEWRRPMDEMLVKPTEEKDTEMSEGGPVEQPNEDSTSIVQAQDVSDQTDSNKVPEEILSQPLVRITEGYKAGQRGIAHTAVSKKKGNPEVGKAISIYEEQSAITALAWNPNLKFGTWAVAGMGSGLLRVEDVGISGTK
jgi:transcription factor C subunit 6